MKKCLSLLCAWMIVLSCVLQAAAAEGNVEYSGDSGSFIFSPGSEYSPTDLFLNFKDVMPGDSIVQPILVKNEASREVKVKIYMRALGAHPDSEVFLSQLRLRVEKSGENTLLFDAAADESAQLTDWVCLGTLYSGGEVSLDVILDVPVELDAVWQNQIGMLDWEFMVEEYEIEHTDPRPPETGDDNELLFWFGLTAVSFCCLLLLLFGWKRDSRKTGQNVDM